MHDFVSSRVSSTPSGAGDSERTANTELSMGHVFQAAVQAGLFVQTSVFPEGFSLDIGTPEDLVIAVRDSENFT
jgi:NDP-sugar pyrophosphorylase family protein